ncbi:hypothetical protein [Aurantiacibacter poecillastricola]|uniref:hypothetical protein n=1 Tax=Aurantiacibacter poecillastricola TaxID=3064385 RepID=UPI00273E0F63|nr:hypothetical protein [Aurantiacibacter sp. 219JJ12-13]MDP5260581.1 hypothetical protein [Aurantiacibacter sp. 219JJ12-13]
MNAISPDFRSPQSRGMANANGTSLRWAALGEAGQVVAMLAGQDGEAQSREVRNFPALMRNAESWRRELIDNGCADLAAVMEPGITALLAVNARGADCRPAAEALWHEFITARTALLALLPPTGEMGPRRST